jgi:hypothetical protein
MKTITIDEHGNVYFQGSLSTQETLNVGSALFPQCDTDNEGQFLFYTGIYEDD